MRDLQKKWVLAKNGEVMWMIKQMTSFLLILQSNVHVLKEQNRRELSRRSHLCRMWGWGFDPSLKAVQGHFCVSFCHSVVLCVSVICSCVAVGVGLLPIHFEVTFFRRVDSKLSLRSFKVLWLTVLWHLSVGRYRYVSLSNYVLPHAVFVYMLSFKYLCCFACVILSGIFYPIIFITVIIEVKCFNIARLYLWNRLSCSQGHTQIGYLTEVDFCLWPQ